MAQLDVKGAHNAEPTVGLDALGDQSAASRTSEVTEADDHRLTCVIGLNAGNERSVELHERRAQLKDVTQTGEPGACIIHGEIQIRSYPGHGSPECRVVGDGRVFGHLEYQVMAAFVQKGAQRLSRNDEPWRHVQIQPCRRGEGFPRRQGSLERDGLQFGPEPDRGRFGKHGLGIGPVGEARERLVANDRLAPEVHDRLEDRLEGSVPDDVQDVVTARACLGPLLHVAADERPGQVRELDQGRQ